MWYVMLLALGIWTSCSAMEQDSDDSSSDTGQLVTVSRDWNNGFTKMMAWVRACEYHKNHLERECAAAQQHTECLAYLNTFKMPESDGINNVSVKDAVLDLSGPLVVHRGPQASTIVWIPLNDKYAQLRILKPREEDANVSFVHCMVCGTPDQSLVWAVDNARAIHTWETGQYANYLKFAEKIPGTVRSIGQMQDAATAIFFDDANNKQRVGLAIQRGNQENAEHAFVVVQDEDVTHVQVHVENWYYKFTKADGSWSIYRTHGVNSEVPGASRLETFLQRVPFGGEAMFAVETDDEQSSDFENDENE